MEKTNYVDYCSSSFGTVPYWFIPDGFHDSRHLPRDKPYSSLWRFGRADADIDPLIGIEESGRRRTNMQSGFVTF